MALDIREIKQFFKIGGSFRSPEATEDGKKPTWNNTDGVFDYTDDNVLESAVRENASNRVEFTLKDGTKVYLTLGALAWLDVLSAAVSSVFGRTGAVVATSGDYTAAQVTNAFNKAADDLDDIANGTTNVHLTATKLADITANTADRHSHTNKAVLDLITNAGGGIIPTAQQIIDWTAGASASTEFIQDTVASFLQNITGLTWTYDDIAGTFTPTVTLEAFTTDNLTEGSINKYASSADTQIVIEMTLPFASTVAGRIAAATEGTDYPTGWVLTVGTSPVDIVITHGTGRRVASVSVCAVTGTEEQALFNTAAYNGWKTPDTNSLLIQSLATIPKQIKIYMIFK
ncbi:MAG: hypothetical protein ACYC5G_01185 [Candidatus Doudnabacteria bacterium]